MCLENKNLTSAVPPPPQNMDSNAPSTSASSGWQMLPTETVKTGKKRRQKKRKLEIEKRKKEELETLQKELKSEKEWTYDKRTQSVQTHSIVSASRKS